MAVAERKYVLTRVKAGDYLLPSNDALTIWRVMRYTDGPTNGLNLPHDRDFWGVWKWTGSSPRAIDIEDWSRWEMVSDFHDTRAEAVDAALKT